MHVWFFCAEQVYSKKLIMPTQPALIWEQTVTIPTYPSPMFFENRVNQGASGRVYPNPFTDRLDHETKTDEPYQAAFLENEYIQLIILPRFGGRIHAALDKTNGIDCQMMQIEIQKT
jgi:hypothetical protein